MEKKLIFNFNKNNQIILKSILTKKLSYEEKYLICQLKNSFWKWNMKNQLKWFKKYLKKNDKNNLIMIKDKIIGYTLLRERKAYIGLKKINFLYFDTFIINKNYRQLGFGRMLLQFNNYVIHKLKKHSFLICPKKMVNFYSKLGWKKLKKNKFIIKDHKSAWHNTRNPAEGMTFNLKENTNKFLQYYINS